MTLPNRRAFLGSSLAGLPAAVTGHSAPPEVAPPPRDAVPELAPPPRQIEPVPTSLNPQDTLFLTWQRDPTTTMTVQWIGPPVPADTTIRYVTRTGDAWATAKITAAPFPKT